MLKELVDKLDKSKKDLPDDAIRIADVFNENDICNLKYLRLNYKKFMNQLYVQCNLKLESRGNSVIELLYNTNSNISDEFIKQFKNNIQSNHQNNVKKRNISEVSDISDILNNNDNITSNITSTNNLNNSISINNSADSKSCIRRKAFIECCPRNKKSIISKLLPHIKECITKNSGYTETADHNNIINYLHEYIDNNCRFNNDRQKLYADMESILLGFNIWIDLLVLLKIKCAKSKYISTILSMYDFVKTTFPS